jgi:hypothetical protein
MEGEKSSIINAGHDEEKFCSGNPADMMYPCGVDIIRKRRLEIS